MSNSRRRYRAIRNKLVQLNGYPVGRARQRLNVLAGLISGIVGSKSTHTRDVAKHSGMGAKVTSREKRIERLRQNEQLSYEGEYLPYLSDLLAGLAGHALCLAIDASEMGRGCMTLMVNLIYEHRAIPLIWVVVGRAKGHSSAQAHIDLLEAVRAILPADTEVFFLGDGEFDSIELQAHIQALPRWHFVCRTAKNTQVCVEGEWFSLDDLAILPNMLLSLPEALFTERAFGPVHVIAHWQAQHEEPIYLVTDLELAEEACHWYRRRMRIETFFSDQKSRGFRLDKSHISDPQRLFRLLIAACLAYIWIIYLGVHARLTNMTAAIHRTDRCDLSLFQLGLDLLHHWLEEDLDIYVCFRLPKQFLFA